MLLVCFASLTCKYELILTDLYSALQRFKPTKHPDLDPQVARELGDVVVLGFRTILSKPGRPYPKENNNIKNRIKKEDEIFIKKEEDQKPFLPDRPSS